VWLEIVCARYSATMASFGSRITSNIREQKGYTYSPYSTVSTNIKTSHWVETADVTTAVTGAAIKEILGIGESLAGHLLVCDALTTTFRKIRARRSPSTPGQPEKQQYSDKSQP